MVERIYKILVRDGIPNIEEDEIPITRKLEEDEFLKELENQIYRYYKKIKLSDSKKEKLINLTYLIGVISCLSNRYGSNIDYLVYNAKELNNIEGSFDEKIYLEKTYRKEK